MYCAGCNERFLQGTDDECCPRCGARIGVVPPHWLNDTLLCRDNHDSDDGLAPSDDGESEDELLGRMIHIYECRSLLGAGGMGRVYLAHHIKLGRQCALKILAPRTVAHDVDYVRRFQDEGRAAASLIHPNIVTIHATGEAEGLHYLEMEFVTGHSLQQLLHDEHRLTPIRATVLSCGIAGGLAAAHRAGILHRDLKPDNVLLTRRGIPKIADFGLAKQIYDRNSNERLVGTPNYMAPELLAGHPATPATDVYALGVCYYHLLTGRLPFVGGTLNELRRAAHSEPVPSVREMCPDVSLEMAECVNLMLSKTPGNRPKDGIEAAQLLQAVGGEARDLDSLLTEAFSDSDAVQWKRDDAVYRVSVTLPDGRQQLLFIETSNQGSTGRLLLIYSVCCPADPQHYELALRLNSTVSFGGVSVRDIDGKPHFVMIDTYPRATVDAEEIRHSVLEVAIQADDIENQLTGLDYN